MSGLSGLWAGLPEDRRGGWESEEGGGGKAFYPRAAEEDGNQEAGWGGIPWGLAKSKWHLREQKGQQVPVRADVTSICGRGAFAF